MTPDELHAHLLDPGSYPSLPATLEFRETHASRLYLTDTRVYKTKKAVNFGFLDFSTLERRHHFCIEEILLNRRFAPGIYLGVVPILSHYGQVTIDGKIGEIVEYAVVMRRLPEERMLDRLLAAHDPSLPKEAVRLGTSLAQMHQSCQICRAAKDDAVVVIRRNWEENFSQAEHYAGLTILPEALALCRDRIADATTILTPEIKRRQAAGLVRDGHGDLHAEHICLTEPLCIYDCIEFNRRFRVGDILADLAFLLMDLDKRGEQELAKIIEKRWSLLLGYEINPALLSFYEIYRAFVRGKVASLLADDPHLTKGAQIAAIEEAKEYFALALGYLCPQTLFITCAPMGVGKTTLSRTLSRAVRGTHLRSDLVRKELHGLDPGVHRLDPFGQGLYDQSSTQLTYDRLLNLTAAEIAAGHSVVVDGAFADPGERRRFRQLATEAGLPFVLLDLYCDEEVTLRRLEARWQEGADPSDGRPELYFRHLSAFRRPVGEEGVMAVDGTRDRLDNTQKILVDYLTLPFSRKKESS